MTTPFRDRIGRYLFERPLMDPGEPEMVNRHTPPQSTDVDIKEAFDRLPVVADPLVSELARLASPGEYPSALIHTDPGAGALLKAVAAAGAACAGETPEAAIECLRSTFVFDLRRLLTHWQSRQWDTARLKIEFEAAYRAWARAQVASGVTALVADSVARWWTELPIEPEQLDALARDIERLNLVLKSAGNAMAPSKVREAETLLARYTEQYVQMVQSDRDPLVPRTLSSLLHRNDCQSGLLSNEAVAAVVAKGNAVPSTEATDVGLRVLSLQEVARFYSMDQKELAKRVSAVRKKAMEDEAPIGRHFMPITRVEQLWTRKTIQSDMASSPEPIQLDKENT